MTTHDAEMDALGAEAFPGGLAEIQRELQSATSAAHSGTRPERRNAEHAGRGDRRQPSSADAG